jgi:murein DD-endopeptidase MepM/ murein hydrolase activator NlpD
VAENNLFLPKKFLKEKLANMEKTLPPDLSGNRQTPAARQRSRSRRSWNSNRIRNKLICIAVLFGMSALIMAIGLKTTTSVLYNGQLVGIVESKEVAYESVAKAETMASEILGKDCSISSGITYRKGIAATNLSAEELTTAILDKVDGIQRLYVLTIDGNIIGGTVSRKDIEDLLVSILEKNMSPTSMSAKFSENTQIVQLFVAKGSVPDFAEMKNDLTEPRADGTYLLNVETVEEVEYTSPVLFPTQYVQDNTMMEGQSATLNPGSNGEAIVTEKMTLREGTKVNSEIMDTKVISNPTPAVVAVGTIPRSKSKGYYIWPANGVVTSEYGYRNVGIGGAFHSGIDVGVSLDSSIYAADGGTVIFSGWYSDYGNLIEIKHDNGDVTRYAHNSTLLVSVGDKVAQGDVIAKAGATGLADGVHCHFEIISGGVRINPKNLLP